MLALSKIEYVCNDHGVGFRAISLSRLLMFMPAKVLVCRPVKSGTLPGYACG